MHTMLDAGLGDPLCSFDVDKLEVFLLFDFVSGAEEVDDDVRVLDHSFDLLLVLVVHGVVDPCSVFVV